MRHSKQSKSLRGNKSAFALEPHPMIPNGFEGALRSNHILNI
jgi:hypothetical protein